MSNTLKIFLNLLDAIRKNQHEFIVEFKDAGAELEADGNRALKDAIVYGHIECVCALLENGVNPNIGATYYGGSPLAYAIRLGLPEYVSTLLAAGADPKSVTDEVWGSYYNEGTYTFEKELRELLFNAKIQTS